MEKKIRAAASMLVLVVVSMCVQAQVRTQDGVSFFQSLSTTIQQDINNFIHAFDGVNEFAQSNGISLAFVIFLLILAVLWGMVWMFLIVRGAGTSHGVSIWFTGNFLLLLTAFLYIIFAYFLNKMNNSLAGTVLQWL